MEWENKERKIGHLERGERREHKNFGERNLFGKF